VCIEPTSQLSVYLKTELISITFAGGLNLTNIIFDGSENILAYNPTLTVGLETCLNTRIRCCNTGQTTNLFYNATCIPSSLAIDTGIMNIPSAFLIINQTDTLITYSSIYNMIFSFSRTFVMILQAQEVILTDLDI
jgi:hypothetical protein